MVRRNLGVLSLLMIGGSLAVGCAQASEEDVGSGEDQLQAKADEHWFYTGDVPSLENATVTVSLVGHTARVQGTLPAGASVPALPHVLSRGRRVDIVYPIATAGPGSTNSRPGNYDVQYAMPYKPNALAVTVSDPTPHFVTWGGFPFIGYNGGIGLHGPITARDNVATPDMDTWYLRRGRVSGGCNRMMGEHVVELTQAIGVGMRKVYKQRQQLQPQSPVDVVVLNDYDKLDYADGSEAKYIDVDYPTDDAATARMRRPGSVHGADKVVMFGSWIASETPDGRDLPPNMDGLNGPYVFADHVLRDKVCSFPSGVLSSLAKIAEAQPNRQLPSSLCEPVARKCLIDVVNAGRAPRDAARCLGLTM